MKVDWHVITMELKEKWIITMIVKILSIANVQDFKPVALDLTKSEFTYELKKDLIDSINIDINPISDGIEEILSERDPVINILGIHSEFIESLTEDSRYCCNNITEKIKQTKIAKEVKKVNTSFHVLLFGYKQPVWALFEEISFDCILLKLKIWSKCIQLFKAVRNILMYI